MRNIHRKPPSRPAHHENIRKAWHDANKALTALKEAARYGNPDNLCITVTDNHDGQRVDAALDRCIAICESVCCALAEGSAS